MPLFLRVCSTSFLKTLREKEKLLVSSNFSFYQSVFYLFGELFIPFSTNLKLLYHSYASSFGFEESKNLSFGKGLNQSTCVRSALASIPRPCFQYYHMYSHIRHALVITFVITKLSWLKAIPPSLNHGHNQSDAH